MQNRGARRGRSAGGGSSKRNAGTTSIPYDPVLARLEGARCRERGAIERERFVHRRSPPLSAFLFPTSCFPFFSLSLPPPPKNNAEAESLHQRATRRHDDSSLELFEASAVAFRDALSGRAGAQGGNAASPLAPDAADLRPLPPLKQACALFGLAEAFQGWASRLVERAEAAPSEELTRAAEAQAAANATTLLAQAVGAYAAASGAAKHIAEENQQSDGVGVGNVVAASSSPSSSPAAAAAAARANASHLLADAVVNAGNALCEWSSLLSKAAAWPPEAREQFKFATSAEDASAGAAELLAAAAATPAEAASLSAALPQPRRHLVTAALALVVRAVEAYELAAALPGADDADTRLNLADALVQAGELAAEGPPAPSSAPSPGPSLDGARGFYLRAFKAFEEAVARASSEEGDDLPALLLNWGVALHSAFTKLHGEKNTSSSPPSSASDASLLSSPQVLLKEAEARLRESASFGRGDPSPLCALGDVLCDRAAAAAAGAPAANLSADDGDAPRTLYERAISEGYGAALAIDRRCAAASAGKGDALLALSRLAAAASAAGDASASAASAAAGLAEEAARAYSNALSEAPRLGGLDERGSVIYNAACASARAADPFGGGGRGGAGAGGETAVEGARRRVRLLVAGGGVSARDVLKDEDLACLRGEAWLLDVAKAEEAAERSGEAMRE